MRTKIIEGGENVASEVLDVRHTTMSILPFFPPIANFGV